MSIPDTRASLLLRIRDPHDVQAWDEFVQIYRQVIYRMAIHRGMQPADAEDLTQHVLMAVSRAIDRFEIEPGRAKFRTWLKTIARNAILNAVTRGQEYLSLEGDPENFQDLMETTDESQALSLDYRRQVFLAAAAQVKSDFLEKTWQAFWQSTVEGKCVDSVAEELQISRGMVYAARCRVIQRLKEHVLRLEDEVS